MARPHACVAILFPTARSNARSTSSYIDPKITSFSYRQAKRQLEMQGHQHALTDLAMSTPHVDTYMAGELFTVKCLKRWPNSAHYLDSATMYLKECGPTIKNLHSLCASRWSVMQRTMPLSIFWSVSRSMFKEIPERSCGSFEEITVGTENTIQKSGRAIAVLSTTGWSGQI